MMVKRLIHEHRWSLLAVYVLILGVATFGAVRSEQNASQLEKQISHTRILIKKNRLLIKQINKVSKRTDVVLKQSIYVNCINFSGVLADLVEPSIRTLGKPGTPGYDYYLHHPEELMAARKYNRRVLRKINIERCKTLPALAARNP